jgi:hypothetical protein
VCLTVHSSSFIHKFTMSHKKTPHPRTKSKHVILTSNQNMEIFNRLKMGTSCMRIGVFKLFSCNQQTHVYGTFSFPFMVHYREFNVYFVNFSNIPHYRLHHIKSFFFTLLYRHSNLLITYMNSFISEVFFSHGIPLVYTEESVSA